MKNFFNTKIKNQNNRAFTLIELLVVVAIIGILSSVVLASLNSARAKARDARRRSDLNQIRTALVMYYNEYGNYIESGSGCGFAGNGYGWFNFQGANPPYPKSIMKCLIDANIVKTEIVDPSGGISDSSPGSGFAYMKATCGLKTYIYAKMETLPQSATLLDSNNCYQDWDSAYGMNYYITIE